MYITVELCGGLGNQLFQIASTYVVAWEYNYIPIIKNINSSPSIFKDRPVYFNNIFKKVLLIDEELYNKLLFYVINETPNYTPIIITDPHKNYKLSGYFQSPKYIDKHRENILNLFSLNNEYENYIKTLYNDIKKNNKETISLHVRRGDYIQLSHFHKNIDISYYTEALKHFDLTNKLVLVFSDDIDWCKENIKCQNIYYVELCDIIDNLPNEIIELKLMSLCDHNIIANSSFSWWGAWMNNNINKKVIAPKTWFVSKIDNDNAEKIYCDNWIKL